MIVISSQSITIFRVTRCCCLWCSGAGSGAGAEDQDGEGGPTATDQPLDHRPELLDGFGSDTQQPVRAAEEHRRLSGQSHFCDAWTRTDCFRLTFRHKRSNISFIISVFGRCQDLEEKIGQKSAALRELKDNYDAGDKVSGCDFICQTDKTIQACEDLTQQVKETQQDPQYV